MSMGFTAKIQLSLKEMREIHDAYEERLALYGVEDILRDAGYYLHFNADGRFRDFSAESKAKLTEQQVERLVRRYIDIHSPENCENDLYDGVLDELDQIEKENKQ